MQQSFFYHGLKRNEKPLFKVTTLLLNSHCSNRTINYAAGSLTCTENPNLVSEIKKNKTNGIKTLNPIQNRCKNRFKKNQTRFHCLPSPDLLSTSPLRYTPHCINFQLFFFFFFTSFGVSFREEVTVPVTIPSSPSQGHSVRP